MKICCDRCERIIRDGCDMNKARIIEIMKTTHSCLETKYLCDKCFDMFLDFIEEGHKRNG